MATKTVLALLAAVIAGALIFWAFWGAVQPQLGQQDDTEQRSPYTGQPADPAPVLAVKVDNAKQARPHTGLDKADIVYVEKVEGGQSRLIGIFSSQQPDSIGPVRSARESDIELLRQFDRPALAYSGVRKALIETVEESPLYALPPGDAPKAYFRDPDRRSPHNLFVRPEEALRAAPDASLSEDIGFRFGPRPADGKPTDERTVRYASASTSFNWSAKEKRWLASFDGTPARTEQGERLGAPTVVIQHVTMQPSRYKDVTGAVTPYIETVGSGKATVLRDGQAFNATWQRETATDGTSFSQPGGEPMPFARGQVWVVYADR
ncbi:DUF3048 domain-containing protein [Streptomyces gobiensis]|uniref:DUF3048 domain-containing protein n=1 Tax=Streptomyces gobiensis TaxID=2875706 RepID=UPI001E306E31|nr:DUF3048 domain-containing protein [Streptomyces gobiensis]UGY92252.1 DUF3048 domain-containing protein [Streptomyces gobiensis]